MSLVDKLSDSEKEMIKNYIKDYALESTSMKASLDHILRFWDSNKSQYLYDLLGKQFMITKPVTFKQDVDETADQVQRAVMTNPKASQFLSDWRRRFGWDSDDLDRFMDPSTKYILYNLPSWNILASNTWNGDNIIVPLPDETSFKLQRGAKVTKAMGKIAKAFDLNMEDFEAFRIACSQGLNQKQLKGNLTLSIHPLDYMTMSDNECDWSSCMSWMEGGCYRQGTVEMMNSPIVIVAYLAAEDSELSLHGHKWNSKKWRELILVNQDMICNVWGYPYRNSYLSQAAISMVKDLADKNLGWKYFNNKPIAWHQEEHFNLTEEKETYILTETFHMYNDFSDRIHYGYFNADFPESYDLNYSGPAECMACGCEDPDIDDESFLVGCCCEETIYCDCCNERVNPDNAVYVDDMCLCEYCAEDHVMDDIFGEPHYDDNLRRITLVSDDNRPSYDCVYVHFNDWRTSVLKRFFNKLRAYRYQHWCGYDYYVRLEDLTEDGVELFYDATGCSNVEQIRTMFDQKWYQERDPINFDEDGKVYALDEGDALEW